MKNWRDSVDPLIKDHLEIQIKEASRHKKAYDQAANKGDAQLWIAIANISKQVFNIELKIKYLERLLQDLVAKINTLEAKTEVKEVKEEKPKEKIIKKPIKKINKKKSLKKALKRF